jgi:hypothetical protein
MKYFQIGLNLIIIFVLSFGLKSVNAEIIQSWTPKQSIPDFEIETERGPFIVSDRNHTVHALNSQSFSDGSRAIVYRQWTQSSGWTGPIDIFWEPIDGITLELLDIFLDSNYVIHIIFVWGGDIYYSRSYLLYAGQASSWSAPTLIGNMVSHPYNGAIRGNNEGKFVITYGGLKQGSGLYTAFSDNDGRNWTEPISVKLAFDPEDRLGEIELFYGESGLIHAVWVYYGVSGFGTEGFYSKLDINTKAWIEPIPLDDSPGAELPSVVEYERDVFISYYHWNINGQWYRVSSDNGDNWSKPIRLSNRHEGRNGSVSFVVDSSQTLHLFFAERTIENIHGVWHFLWKDRRWIDRPSVIEGPRIVDEVGGKGFDPHSANAVIVNGNIVLVTWATDGGAGLNGGWYSYAVLDSPKIAAEEIPALTPQLQISPSPSITIIPTEQLIPASNNWRDDISDNSRIINNNISFVLFSTTILVVMIVILIVSLIISNKKH